jgi:hypothetical protein
MGGIMGIIEIVIYVCIIGFVLKIIKEFKEGL